MNTSRVNFPLYGYITHSQSVLVSANGIQIRKTTFQNEHSKEYLVAEYVNDVIHGEARLYDNGLLKLRWKCDNGIQYGKFYVYEKGMLLYTSICKKGEPFNGCCYIKNTDSSRWLYIHEPVTKALEYIGNFGSDEISREGWGVEFEKGQPRRCGIWKKDELVCIEKTFECGEMTEYIYDYPENALSTPRVSYIGEYLDDFSLHFPRHGKGRLVNPTSGIVYWYGLFDKGKQVEGKDCDNDGWYKNNSEPDWVVIDSIPDLLFAFTFVERLKICDNSCNDISFSILDLSSSTFLKNLVIGDNCFIHTKVFKVVDNQFIQTISIGTVCFMPRTIPSKKGEGLFLLTNLPSLLSVEVGVESFTQYTTFTINSILSLHYQLDLPLLSQLTIGKTTVDSRCFSNCCHLCIQSTSLRYDNTRFPLA